ncbi:MAG: response regulator [Deltaproteobacteria bacterium]|nr:response regulator [Deltaproteobacteria bacterium]
MAENNVEKEKISGLENLLPELVHKLNNHLGSMLAYGQLLLPKMIDAESKRYLAKIIEEAWQASHVIKDLVDFTRKRKPQKEAVDLNRLIESVLNTKIRELDARRIKVVKELSPSIPLAQVDPNQMREVLVNLINNAEGTITEFYGFGEIRVKTCEKEGEIEMIISDDGPGVPAENISKIFDPFFMTIKGRGTGLELTISHGTVIEHGGKMRVESEWGKGTTFIVTLPIVEGQVEKKEEEGKRTEVNLRGLKGLVIDDEPAFLDAVSKYLKLMGCKITTASDAKKALANIENIDFDFVICDIRMPKMSGIEFYCIINEKKPSLKERIIFSTGDVLNDTTREFMESITNPSIEKPFDMSSLKEVIIKMLEKIENRQTPAR